MIENREENMIGKKIIECEMAYAKCFSAFFEEEDVIRFRDNQLEDMYYHNFTYLKKAVSLDSLKQIIDREISLRLSEKKDFCNILLDYSIEKEELSRLGRKPGISRNGYYSFDISQLPKFKTVEGSLVKRCMNQGMIEDVLFCDLQHDEVRHGKDFCERRCYRRGPVYLSDQGVDSYVCYHQGEVIGNCNLFIHNGTAKIEDFAVIPSFQRKGYGTTILKALIEIALRENAHTIYLVTDEEDTAKEMYRKIGFEKIGERVDLFFKGLSIEEERGK